MKTFENLTPEMLISAVEKASGMELTGLTMSLPSYINRVYELRAKDGTKLVAKFYRPGRWSRESIMDEHRFVRDCTDAEIPVVAPLKLNNDTTLGQFEEIYFAVYPKRAGRQFEINDDSDYIRLGSLVGRLHCTGAQGKAPGRITINPSRSTLSDVKHLCDSIIPPAYKDRYKNTALRLIDTIAPLFESVSPIRIHGDLHYGNILDRLDEGLLLIDFDDMAMGPPVQDLWLLLPGRAHESNREIDLILRGYEQFRQFDRASLRCIEPLRAMRMIYFLAWCSKQIDDFQFRRNFPDWGTDRFWQKEINDLQEQLGFCIDATELYNDENDDY